MVLTFLGLPLLLLPVVVDMLVDPSETTETTSKLDGIELLANAEPSLKPLPPAFG